tara:strand:+ start:2910 stop:3773 length:864 start_codon:yes stop_codon:yes gene_type:complete
MTKSTQNFTVALVVVIALAAGAWFLMGNSSNGVAAMGDDTQVAKVNETVITRGDVKEVAKTVPAAAQVPIEQIYPMIVDQLINDALLQDRVDASGIATDPEVEQRLAEAREQIARSLYVERYLEEQMTEEALRAEYEQMKSDNANVKEVRARHILVETEDAANALIAQLDDGADFAELARENSTGPTASNGGDLGYFTKDAMVPEFSNVAFATEAGTYSEEPVKTQFGWHVIMVEDVRNRQVPTFEEMEPVLRQQMQQDVVNNLVENLRDGADIQRYDWDGKEVSTN